MIYDYLKHFLKRLAKRLVEGRFYYSLRIIVHVNINSSYRPSSCQALNLLNRFIPTSHSQLLECYRFSRDRMGYDTGFRNCPCLFLEDRDTICFITRSKTLFRQRYEKL